MLQTSKSAFTREEDSMTDTFPATNDPVQNRIGQSLQAIFQLIPTLFRPFDQVRLVIEMFETL